jgi:hypothetical protein
MVYRLGFPGSVRMNTGFANDCAIFLMVLDDHLVKLVAVAEIDIQSQRRHALLNIRKLSGLTNGLADARDDFRWHPGRLSIVTRAFSKAPVGSLLNSLSAISIPLYRCSLNYCTPGRRQDEPERRGKMIRLLTPALQAYPSAPAEPA